jgi:hypothetical protein
MRDELDADENAAKLVSYSFYNRGRPDVLITLPGMRAAALRAFRDDWLSSLMGPKNVNKAHFTNVPDVDAKILGEDFRSLQMIDLRRFSRDTIRQVLGIPPEVLGIIENSNRSTIDAATYIFNQHVIEPMLEQRRAFLQRQLIDEFDDRLILDYVSPADEDKEFALKVANSQPYIMTIDEWRAMAGKDRVGAEKGGNLYVVPGSGVKAVEDLKELLNMDTEGTGDPTEGQPTPLDQPLNIDGVPMIDPVVPEALPGIHSPEDALVSAETSDTPPDPVTPGVAGLNSGPTGPGTPPRYRYRDVEPAKVKNTPAEMEQAKSAAEKMVEAWLAAR